MQINKKTNFNLKPKTPIKFPAGSKDIQASKSKINPG